MYSQIYENEECYVPNIPLWRWLQRKSYDILRQTSSNGCEGDVIFKPITAMDLVQEAAAVLPPSISLRTSPFSSMYSSPNSNLRRSRRVLGQVSHPCSWLVAWQPEKIHQYMAYPLTENRVNMAKWNKIGVNETCFGATISHFSLGRLQMLATSKIYW